MPHPRDQSLADNISEMKRLRKEVFKNQSMAIRAYGHLLNKALDSEDIHAEVQQVRDNLYDLADKLKEMSDKI